MPVSGIWKPCFHMFFPCFLRKVVRHHRNVYFLGEGISLSNINFVQSKSSRNKRLDGISCSVTWPCSQKADFYLKQFFECVYCSKIWLSLWNTVLITATAVYYPHDDKFPHKAYVLYIAGYCELVAVRWTDCLVHKSFKDRKITVASLFSLFQLSLWKEIF